MKNSLYKIINKIGYKIENKKKIKSQQIESLRKKFAHANNFDLLFKAKELIYKIEKKFPDFTLKNHEEGFVLSFAGNAIYVESVEEFFIINEVFVEEEYKFNTSNKVIVLDIGTNIGTAALYFSALKNVEKIYCFEPVETTFNQAKYNFSINEKASKIAVFNNFGLGKNDRNETFLFDKKVKGNTGLRGKMSNSYSNNTTTEEVEVKIKCASTQIQTILEANPNSKFVVKMDCEGAEYEIFENLTPTILSSIDIYMIEWHDKGKEVLEEKLLKNGFNLFLKELAPNAGIILASKS